MLYTPSQSLTASVLTGIMAPMPWAITLVAKAVPYKEKAVSAGLQQVIPLSLRAMASSITKDAHMVLTSHGELTEEVKQSILRRIVSWFVPSEVADVTRELNNEIVRLGKEGYGEDGSWRLEARSGEVVLINLGGSFLKDSADTVFDVFFDSYESLKKVKGTAVEYIQKKRG